MSSGDESQEEQDTLWTVLVVGTGLIGTSLGLALQGQAEVLLQDVDDAHLRAAVGRGAGAPWDGRQPVDLAVVCIPPAQTAAVIAGLLRAGLAQTASHVASVQTQVQLEVERKVPGDVQAGFCGGHPMAGRAQSGPAAASARLFLGRPWVVCPTATTSASAVQRVERLARAVGAEPVEMPADAHDAAVALVSHLPQVAASAVAARLADVPPGASGAVPPALRLAGPGLQDTTRIAASDDRLWADVLRANAAQVAPLVRRLAADLDHVGSALERLAAGDAAASAVVVDLLRRGRAGRAALPTKPTAGGLDLTPVVVSVPDQPGQIAGVLHAAAAAGVNVEDVRVEHLPGRPRGLLELLVASASAEPARAALTAAGWEVVAG